MHAYGVVVNVFIDYKNLSLVVNMQEIARGTWYLIRVIKFGEFLILRFIHEVKPKRAVVDWLSVVLKDNEVISYWRSDMSLVYNKAVAMKFDMLLED